MIDYHKEQEYANKVLELLGDEYKSNLTEKSANMGDVRLRFFVFQGYANSIPEAQIAQQIKDKFPILGD